MHLLLRILRIYFLWYQENSHPENFHQSNPTLVNFPKKFPPGIGNLLPLSLILLKRMFYNSMFQKCWSLYACENLSKWSVKWGKAINEMGGKIPDENFLGGNSTGRIFQGGVWWVGIFRMGIPPGGISLKPFSSYDVSILIFQKIISKYNKTFNKKIYTLNSWNAPKNVFPATFCFNEREVFST